MTLSGFLNVPFNSLWKSSAKFYSVKERERIVLCNCHEVYARAKLPAMKNSVSFILEDCDLLHIYSYWSTLSAGNRETQKAEIMYRTISLMNNVRQSGKIIHSRVQQQHKTFLWKV